MTDGNLAQFVNALTSVAKTYAHHQSLRERISRLVVPEIDALRQQVKEQDEFIQQLATHARTVEEEVVQWRAGLKKKSKSPYLSGELAGDVYAGLGYVPEETK